MIAILNSRSFNTMKRDSPTEADDHHHNNNNNQEQEPPSSSLPEKMCATAAAVTSSTSGEIKDEPAAAKESEENEEPVAKKVKLEKEEEEEATAGGEPEEEKAKDASGKDKDAATSSGDGDEWESFLERLTRFKEQHGHCNPPLESEEGPGLGEWVAKQRDLYKGADENEKLTDYQIEKLSQVGFDWQPRNPRHLQWETRFAQLQAFKKKYGHVQVPIGWSENVQLANWVSKQRQEYKNLLRGRSTRLDENRIRLLNSVGFAWQLQRGGRRRQLKARSKSGTGGAEGDNHSSDGEAKGEGEEEDGPCILPGEVLIGQGASNPLSPEADGVMALSKGGKKSRANNKGAAGSADGTGASPLQQSYMQGSMLTAAGSPMGMGYPRGAGGGGGALGGAGGGGQANNELLDIMLARNALFQNFQRPAGMGVGGHHPMAFQMLGTGAYSGLSAYNGFQQAAAANQHAQFLAAAQQAGRNPLFQPPMFPFAGGAAAGGGQFAGAAGFNFQGGAGGGGAGWNQGASGEESKLGGGGGGLEGDQSGMQGYGNFGQQQGGGQMFQGNMNMHRAGTRRNDPPTSGGTSPVNGFQHQGN